MTNTTDQKQNEPNVAEDRTVRIPLHPDVAQILLDNDAEARDLASAIRTLEKVSLRSIAKIAKNAGHDIRAFPAYELERQGALTVLALIPPPLPVPETPQKPAPKE